MKLSLLLLLVFCAQTGFAQVKDYNKNRQVEQLQQLKQTVSRKIDSLQIQLLEQAARIEDTRKKLEQLKKECNKLAKPDPDSKEQTAKLSIKFSATNNLADSLQKTFDMRLNTLDKTLNLQKDLEEKINALVKESNW